jgi:4-hydroxy-tetrahydrodipicolinate synthase
MNEFAGVHAAAITPRGKQGEVDMGAAFELIDYLCAAGLRGIVLFGDSGEYPAFNADERSRLIYLAVKRSRVPVLAGVGSATLDISLDLAREARDAGAAGLMLPPPFFLRYEPDDVREFYLEFSRQMGRDAAVFLSNTPAVSSDIPVETALELLDTGRFAGIEEGRGSLESFLRMKAAANGGAYQVLMGNDAIFTRARCAGGCCAISAAACAAPELVMALDRAITAAGREQIERLDGALQEFVEWAGRFPPPVVVKVAAGLRGLKTGPVTVPLSPAKRELLDEFRAWFQAWLPAVKRLCANG